MKSILMSIRPEWVAKILNGEKTIEIRKKFPKDYVGWVYIYVTKDENKKLYFSTFHGKYMVAKYVDHKHKVLNGKVVAKFTLNKVETIFAQPDRYDEFYFYNTGSLDMEKLLKQSCLEYNELDDYLYAQNGYAWHIDNLVIFDKPMELKEFKTIQKGGWDLGCFNKGDKGIPLTRAPESWCYIEV